MKYFWFDHKEKNQRPEYEPFSKLVELFNAQKVLNAKALPQVDSICFVHAGDDTGEQTKDWEEWASQVNKHFVVFLSIGGEPTSTKKEEDGVYLLPKSRLNRMVSGLKQNINLLAEFKQTCDIGKPNLNLLAPSWEIENLLAVYLILIAKNKGVNAELDNKIWRNAFGEFNKLAKHFGKPNSESVEDLDANEIAILLGELCLE